METAFRTDRLGATVVDHGVHFAVRSQSAASISICLFDPETGAQTSRTELRQQDGLFSGLVGDAGPGTHYGLRAEGVHDPDAGLFFDPAKLLVDPYATRIDQSYRYDQRLSAPRAEDIDTASLVPKAIVETPLPDLPAAAPIFDPGGLIYELGVRSFSMRHPEIAGHERGTLSALKHPAIIEHLKSIGVSAIELMPITAWIDERHLQPLGLGNAWGYNPVSFMALNPRLAPGGIADLRDVTAALHAAGIGVILDVVFNHTGESDRFGPTLSLRGLDNPVYYRHDPDGRLINDSGCGNTIACDHPTVRKLILDSLGHFVRQAGVDGFRFDLATVLGRSTAGFDHQARLFSELAEDPVLGDRIMIAEPWDIGPGGYQLGNFPPNFLEWNDRFRDGLRRFWRGDVSTVGELATRLAGSSDVFQRKGCEATRSVNFIAAHDGFSLHDLVSYEHKHNAANGESNRDGHDDNLSWNNGIEGTSCDPAVVENRRRDVEALLATLFASRGTIMLTAGDEFGRSQKGNNNAYAQDNDITWLDWANRDLALQNFVSGLARMRADLPVLRQLRFLDGHAQPNTGVPDVSWLRPDGTAMAEADWNGANTDIFVMILACGESGTPRQLAICFNRSDELTHIQLPAKSGYCWRSADKPEQAFQAVLPARSSRWAIECEIKNTRTESPHDPE